MKRLTASRIKYQGAIERNIEDQGQGGRRDFISGMIFEATKLYAIKYRLACVIT